MNNGSFYLCIYLSIYQVAASDRLMNNSSIYLFIYLSIYISIRWLPPTD